MVIAQYGIQECLRFLDFALPFLATVTLAVTIKEDLVNIYLMWPATGEWLDDATFSSKRQQILVSVFNFYVSGTIDSKFFERDFPQFKCSLV